MDKLIVGCGYLGRRVAARWRRQGHRVYATTRTFARADELRTLGLEPLICDVLDPASLASDSMIVVSAAAGDSFGNSAGFSYTTHATPISVTNIPLN